jgi:hypothetical protein
MAGLRPEPKPKAGIARLLFSIINSCLSYNAVLSRSVESAATEDYSAMGTATTTFDSISAEAQPVVSFASECSQTPVLDKSILKETVMRFKARWSIQKENSTTNCAVITPILGESFQESTGQEQKLIKYITTDSTSRQTLQYKYKTALTAVMPAPRALSHQTVSPHLTSKLSALNATLLDQQFQRKITDSKISDVKAADGMPINTLSEKSTVEMYSSVFSAMETKLGDLIDITSEEVTKWPASTESWLRSLNSRQSAIDPTAYRKVSNGVQLQSQSLHLKSSNNRARRTVDKAKTDKSNYINYSQDTLTDHIMKHLTPENATSLPLQLTLSRQSVTEESDKYTVDITSAAQANLISSLTASTQVTTTVALGKMHSETESTTSVASTMSSVTEPNSFQARAELPNDVFTQLIMASTDSMLKSRRMTNNSSVNSIERESTTIANFAGSSMIGSITDGTKVGASSKQVTSIFAFSTASKATAPPTGTAFVSMLHETIEEALGTTNEQNSTERLVSIQSTVSPETSVTTNAKTVPGKTSIPTSQDSVSRHSLDLTSTVKTPFFSTTISGSESSNTARDSTLDRLTTNVKLSSEPIINEGSLSTVRRSSEHSAVGLSTTSSLNTSTVLAVTTKAATTTGLTMVDITTERKATAEVPVSDLTTQTSFITVTSSKATNTETAQRMTTANATAPLIVSIEWTTSSTSTETTFVDLTTNIPTSSATSNDSIMKHSTGERNVSSKPTLLLSTSAPMPMSPETGTRSNTSLSTAKEETTIKLTNEVNVSTHSSLSYSKLSSSSTEVETTVGGTMTQLKISTEAIASHTAPETTATGQSSNQSTSAETETGSTTRHRTATGSTVEYTSGERNVSTESTASHTAPETIATGQSSNQSTSAETETGSTTRHRTATGSTVEHTSGERNVSTESTASHTAPETTATGQSSNQSTSAETETGSTTRHRTATGSTVEHTSGERNVSTESTASHTAPETTVTGQSSNQSTSAETETGSTTRHRTATGSTVEHTSGERNVSAESTASHTAPETTVTGQSSNQSTSAETETGSTTRHRTATVSTVEHTPGERNVSTESTESRITSETSLISVQARTGTTMECITGTGNVSSQFTASGMTSELNMTSRSIELTMSSKTHKTTVAASISIDTISSENGTGAFSQAPASLKTSSRKVSTSTPETNFTVLASVTSMGTENVTASTITRITAERNLTSESTVLTATYSTTTKKSIGTTSEQSIANSSKSILWTSTNKPAVSTVSETGVESTVEQTITEHHVSTQSTKSASATGTVPVVSKLTTSTSVKTTTVPVPIPPTTSSSPSPLEVGAIVVKHKSRIINSPYYYVSWGDSLIISVTSPRSSPPVMSSVYYRIETLNGVGDDHRYTLGFYCWQVSKPLTLLIQIR